MGRGLQQHGDPRALRFIPALARMARGGCGGAPVCHRTGLFCLPGTGPGADREPELPHNTGTAPFMQSHHSKQHGHGWAGRDGRACAARQQPSSKAQQMDVACGWLVAMG